MMEQRCHVPTATDDRQGTAGAIVNLEMGVFCHACQAELRPQATSCDQCGAAAAPAGRPAVEWVQAGAFKKRGRLRAIYARKLTWVIAAAVVPAIAVAVYATTPKPLSPDATLARLNAAILAGNEQRLSGYIDTPGMASGVFGRLLEAAKARDPQGASLSPVTALTYKGLEARKYEVISAVEAKLRQDLFTDGVTGKPTQLALVAYQEADVVHEAMAPGARRARKARACTVTLKNPATGKTFVLGGSHYQDSKHAWFLERLEVGPGAAYGEEVTAFARRAFDELHRDEARKARSALAD